MTDLTDLLDDPEVIASTIERFQRTYDAALKCLVSWQVADSALDIRDQRSLVTAKAVAALTASITGNLSAVRKVHGAHVAEAMLRQIAADAGLTITWRKK